MVDNIPRKEYNYIMFNIEYSDVARAFYFFIVGKTIIFTNGYIKKKQKLSTKDFELAIKYKEDYFNRIGGK